MDYNKKGGLMVTSFSSCHPGKTDCHRFILQALSKRAGMPSRVILIQSGILGRGHIVMLIQDMLTWLEIEARQHIVVGSAE